MSQDEDSILTKLDITIPELTDLVKSNPSLRGVLLGYVAEMKLKKMWFSTERITHSIKYDDHDRKKKGDLVVTYKNQTFTVESKSLQTNLIRRNGDTFVGRAQCDASDRRVIKLPDGTKLNTTCLLVREFDLLAVNVFAFEGIWRFVFAKNDDLPRSRFAKYTSKQRQYLLATLMTVTWPPIPPFHAEPYGLLDEIIKDRKRKIVKPIVVESAEQMLIPD